VTQQPFESKRLYPAFHVRNTIEHLIESGIVEGELADTWKDRMAEKKRSEEELKETKEAAENGDVEAMYILGYMYDHVFDLEEAYKWHKKAADAGHVKATALAGACLLYGWGVKKDRTEGHTMLAVAAAGGSNYACYKLGEMYFNGLCGPEINCANAKQWLEKAVAKGEGSCEYKHLDDESIEKAQRWIECLS